MTSAKIVVVLKTFQLWTINLTTDAPSAHYKGFLIDSIIYWIFDMAVRIFLHVNKCQN